MYRATAASVRERLMERWDETYAHFTAENPKMIYYLSMEYLQVRCGYARAFQPRAEWCVCAGSRTAECSGQHGLGWRIRGCVE